MAQAGYSLLVRKGGTPVVITGEATTLVTGTTYRITDAARRVIDPTALWHVQDGASTIAFSGVSAFDFLTGEVTLGSSPGGAVTVYGSYVPITTATDTLFECRNFTLNDSNDVHDVTVFTGTTDRTRKRIAGLEDVELSAETLMSGPQAAYLSTLKFNAANVVTEVYFGDAALPRFRGICKIESLERSGNVEDLLSTDVTFRIASAKSAMDNQVAGYTFTVQPNA